MMRFVAAFALLLSATSLPAQGPAAGAEGRWEGALGAGAARLRIVLDITKSSDGLYLGTLTSVDQGGGKFPIDLVRASGDSVHLELRSIGGLFDGVLSADKTRLAGTWSQGGPPTHLEFTRAAATAAQSRPADAPAAPATPSPFGILAELAIPIAPTPFPSGGKTYLVYELHITNFSGVEMLVSRLDVLNGDATLASFEGAELNSILQQPRPNVTDNRAIPPGARAIAFMWLTLDGGSPVPTSLRHRVTVGSQSLTAATVAVATARPIVLSPPLHGADWLAANGPANGSGHRRAMIPLGGHTAIAQRFAIDWVKRGPTGATFSGNDKDNRSYFAYGNEILAVADGVVASIKDGIPENIPGPTSRAVPITPETIGGNYVILDLGGGRFGFYAHMRPGSQRVKLGDRVRRGQVLGLVGNTGNSTEPHLHFHVSNGNTPLESEGLPYVLDAWDIMNASGGWEHRQNQLPLQNARVRFP